MVQKKISVTGIGNAIVDIIANVEDDFLDSCNLDKGTMKLVCEDESARLFSRIKVEQIVSGGSAANTIAGLSVLGNKVAFIGKVKDDDLGKAFASDLAKLGVIFNTRKAPEKAHSSTASCIILSTPDAQRTMNTCLGISSSLSVDDIDEEVIKDSRLIYLEGYLWDQPNAIQALEKAISLASKNNCEIAFSLSDRFCVERHREEFLNLISHYINIIFANESELMSLYETGKFKEAIEAASKTHRIFAITRSEKGSCIIPGSNPLIKVEPLKTSVIDTTGAGDMYAAGFLHGYLRDKSLYFCGRMGSIISSEIISHYGARPEKPLLELLAQEGL